MTGYGPKRQCAAPQQYSRFLGSCGHACCGVDSTQMTRCGRRRSNFLALRYSLFDHVIRATKQGARKGETERFGGLDVDGQLDFRGLLDRKVSRLLTLENAASINAGEVLRFFGVRSIAHEANRKSTRLNSSHTSISYAAFSLK